VASIDSLLPGVASALDDDAIADHYRDGAGSPWLRINFVSSIDGAATVDGASGGLGGDADHRVFDILRRLCEVVLVAAGTVRTEDYGPMRVDAASQAARTAAGLAPHPVFAIVSGSLDLDPASRIFAQAPVRPVIVTTASSPKGKRNALAEVADILVCGDDALDATAMVAGLTELGLSRIHCEGGPSLFGTLVAADVVDELCLTVSPLIASGDAGRIAHGDLPEPRGMTLAGVLRSEDTLLLQYRRAR
jgi:riboflavin biosynthesis pyrimidine reductase